jgi:hypothetical protein
MARVELFKIDDFNKLSTNEKTETKKKAEDLKNRLNKDKELLSKIADAWKFALNEIYKLVNSVPVSSREKENIKTEVKEFEQPTFDVGIGEDGTVYVESNLVNLSEDIKKDIEKFVDTTDLSPNKKGSLAKSVENVLSGVETEETKTVQGFTSKEGIESWEKMVEESGLGAYKTGYRPPEGFTPPEELKETYSFKRTTAPQRIDYTDLIEAPDRTIYRKDGSKAYSAPEELARDMGINPWEIKWEKIEKGPVPTAPKEPERKPSPVSPTKTEEEPERQPETTIPSGQMPYVRYKGWPFVFDRQGNWISYSQAQAGNIWNQIEELDQSLPTDLALKIPENERLGWTPPKEETIVPPAGEKNLIRFIASGKVYDISSGALKEVTQYSPADVILVDPREAELRKQADGKVFVIIGDQEIHIPDMKTFDEAGLSRTIFLEEGEKYTIDVPELIDEYTSGEKLGMIWDRDPDLQVLYDREGNAKPGSGVEGTTIYDWATKIGWKDYPALLEEYKPENVVRSAYLYLFGRDPFDPMTPDPGATAWVDAIKGGLISGFHELTGKMKMDAGGEWAQLSEAERTANLVKWEQTVRDIPEFEEFFPAGAELAKIQKDVDEFYNKEIEKYKEEREIQEGRTIEDWETLTKELTEDEKMELTESQLQFRQALKSATEAYGAAGLTYSSIRAGGEQELKNVLQRRKERIWLETERAKGKLTTEKERRLQDLKRSEEEYIRKTQRTKALEREQTFASKEARAIQRYMAGLEFAKDIPGYENIYGQSAFTTFGKFTAPGEQKQKVSEMFGELKPYGT